MKFGSISALATVLALTACGGGGGGEAGTPAAPPVSDAQAREELRSRIERPGVTITEAFVGEPSCPPDGCPWWFDVGSREDVVLYTLDELRQLDRRDRDREFRGLGSRRGVSLALSEDTSEPDRQYFDYAGWLQHSVFLVNAWYTPHEAAPRLFTIGPASDGNPVSGSMTWTGVMAGIDERQGDSFGNIVEGDAELTLDAFDNPTIDIMLTGIRDRETGAAHADMEWAELGLRGGEFDDYRVRGRFYGPNHEEVGGVFVRDGIAGAFGAKRQ